MRKDLVHEGMLGGGTGRIRHPRMIPVAKGEVLIRLWERRQGEGNRANSRGGIVATRARPESRIAVETSGESWTKPSVIAMVPLER